MDGWVANYATPLDMPEFSIGAAMPKQPIVRNNSSQTIQEPGKWAKGTMAVALLIGKTRVVRSKPMKDCLAGTRAAGPSVNIRKSGCIYRLDIWMGWYYGYYGLL